MCVCLCVVWVDAMHLFFPQWYTALATDFTLGSWFQSSRAPVPNLRSRPSSRTNFQGFRLTLELQGIKESSVVTLTNEKNKHCNCLTIFPPGIRPNLLLQLIIIQGAQRPKKNQDFITIRRDLGQPPALAIYAHVFV